MDIHIIDDDSSTLFRYSSIAKNSGFSSASFDSAEDYLLAMRRDGYQPPKLILSDIEMGAINGYELIHEVREKYPNQRFVINSSTPSIQNRDDYACLYFLKPISTEKLQSLFALISSYMQCEVYPDCKCGRACIDDDRAQFNVIGWTCPCEPVLG